MESDTIQKRLDIVRGLLLSMYRFNIVEPKLISHFSYRLVRSWDGKTK